MSMLPAPADVSVFRAGETLPGYLRLLSLRIFPMPCHRISPRAGSQAGIYAEIVNKKCRNEKNSPDYRVFIILLNRFTDHSPMGNLLFSECSKSLVSFGGPTPAFYDCKTSANCLECTLDVIVIGDTIVTEDREPTLH